MTTNDNTTARQAGLIATMIDEWYFHADEHAKAKLADFSNVLLDRFAAHSADASIYQELDPSGLWEDISKERFDELKIRSDVRVRAFGQSADARNGEGVARMAAEQSFADEMEGLQYGEDETANAKSWFMAGWINRGLAAPAAGTGQEPGCGDGEDCDACLSEAATGAQGLTQEGRNG